MSLAPIAAPQTALVLRELGYAMSCGRDDLHMCKVTTPAMLMTFWPSIRSGLLRLRQKNPPRTQWLPEHVLLELHKGFAGQSSVECFLAHDGDVDETHGFIILYPLIDPFVGLPLRLFVWMLSLEPHVMVQLVPELDAMTLSRGYHGWQMQTGREGWLRRCKAVGARVVEYVIAKDLLIEGA